MIMLEVETISSALYLSFVLLIRIISSLPNELIHFKGVKSSCETEAVKSPVTLFQFSAFFNFLNAVMSLILRILHSSSLKIKFCKLICTIFSFVSQEAALQFIGLTLTSIVFPPSNRLFLLIKQLNESQNLDLVSRPFSAASQGESS